VLGLFAVFGGVSTFVEVHSTIDVLLLVAAIVCGSMLWWITLSDMIGRYRHRIDLRMLNVVNRVAGLLLAIFGAVLIAEVVWKAGRF
jgi:threonine/homoserine/homoserine lactone efflux protein